ncbi:DUF6210 family protein [Streptomyces sparsogenes]|uniref:DUF6210 family protein n=1 Tax=Streptomyces sparsogenes TaxID=67365 RepID=UPI0033D132BA
MTGQRFVFLDPDGASEDWLHVVVQAATGVTYQQQYGGTACLHGQVEGYLVPVFAPDALEGLCELFEGHFQGAGTWHHPWTDEELARLRELVADVTFWACDGRNEKPGPLRLDEDRLAEADEAWLPVTTPDGPGVLLWCNSD